MKKNIVAIISAIVLIISSIAISVFAYYNFLYKTKGSEIRLENVKFQVNDSPNKGEEDVIYFTSDELTEGDGYQINLKYSLSGSFISDYAMKYSTFFEVTDTNNISTAIDVYRFYDDQYHFIDTLDNLKSIESTNTYNSIYTDYLGVSGTHTEKFLLMYSMGDTIEEKNNFSVKISTTSEMVKTTAEEFPYFYLSDMGQTTGEDTTFETAESIFKQLPGNELIYGRTIVLMDDLTYTLETQPDITFNNLVGLDLNGHTINLAGGKITFSDANETNETHYNNKIGIFDSVGGGKLINSTIDINYSNSIIDIYTEFYTDSANKLLNNSDITISKISMNAFEMAGKEKFKAITSSKHTVNNKTFTFDLFGDLKYYLLTNKVSFEEKNISLISARGEATATFNDDNKSITISNVTNSDSISLTLTLTGTGTFENQAVINDILQLYGSTTDSCKDYLESYIPKKLNGSIYLPSYISTFNSYITWISYDENIISNNGMVLPNGYFTLDNWVKTKTNLGFIIDQSGEQMHGVIKDIEITVLPIEDRINLLYDPISVTFNNDDSTSYNFSIIDMLYKKYDSTDLSSIATTYFNITLDTTKTLDEQKTEFLNKLQTKLGLENINITANQESSFVTETTTVSPSNLITGVTELQQSGVPNEVISLIYSLEYEFTDGASTKYKLFNINTGEAEVTLVDLTNSLRVPFDIYSEYMTSYTLDENNNRIYNNYSTRFELVSKFDGVSIDYTVPAEYSNYVKLETDANGNKYISLIRDNVPADTHTVTVTARVSGIDNPIYLPFTCVGVLHNTTSKDHAEFEDGKLYIELLNKYSKNTDNVLTDLEAKFSPITSLSITGMNITSLKGMQYFKNLTDINFSNNKIVNIDDLSSLDKLEIINLNSNNITSIRALNYLDNVKELYLSNNQISSIEPIQYLIELEKLNISYNNIADFRYINLLTNLNELRVYENKISGKYTVDIETYGSNQSGMTEVIRSNQYYFNLLKFNDNALKLYIKNKDTAYNFDANQYALEANVLSQITPIYQTSDTITLPTRINVGGTAYEITYFTNLYSDYIVITRNEQYSVTNITLNQLPVNNKVIIYANTVGLAGSVFYRPLEFYIRKGYSNENHYGEIEVTSNNWVIASALVKDSALLSSLWIQYDTNLDGKITYEELNPNTGVTLTLDSLNIESLDGIQYFGNIKSLNVRSNIFEDLDSDGYADIKYIGYLQNLETLYLSGQLFNFDELLNYSRLPNNGVYENYKNQTITLINVNNNPFEVSLRHGLTSLINLYVNGSLKLNEYSQKTKLYHVYLNNPILGTFTGEGNNKISYGIYKDSQNEIWNPIKEEISRFLGSLSTSAKFINYNDEIQLKKSYEIYLYDDLIPTTFALTSGTISDKEYMFAGGSTGNNPAQGQYVNIYDAGITGNTLKGVDDNFIANSNYLLSSYFNIDTTDDINISIKYQRLVYKDYQAFLNMTLNASTVSQGRRELTTDDNGLNYYMTLFMQYNNDYIFETTDSEANGKSLNAIFGAVETMLFVMNSLSEELRTGLRGYNYTITLNDGSIENHLSTETNTNAEISYIVTESQIEQYTGDYNSLGAYNTDNYFFIHGNFMPSASSAVDGLRFLPQIKKVYFRRDAVLGTGKDLINVEELFVVYTFLNLKDFNVVLPNMKILISGQGTGTNLSDETSLDSNPNNLLETYMVYLPNLVEFYMNGEGENGKGTMYEWSAFLAYSYIPFRQIYNYDETNKTITPTKYYSLDGTNEKIGGIVLDDENKYYWFDFSNDSYDNFKLVYYKSSNGFVALTHSVLVSNLTKIFSNNGTLYDNLYGSPDGEKLAITNQLFRPIRKGTVKLNNFKLNGSAQTYSNTYMNHVVLIELFNNLPTGTTTHYYLNSDPTQGNGHDFDPSFSNITFESNVTDEYDELAPTISNLHVKLTGKTFDGTDLNNTEYNDLQWTNSDYSDYFRQGLQIKLPIKFNDYLTGAPSIDKYRNFTISWYVSYYVYSENTSTTKKELKKEQILINTSSGFINEDTYNDIFSSRNFSNNTLVFTLNYSGYYIFEGLLELSYDNDSYSYYTSYDKNFLLENHSTAVYAQYPYLDQYNYMDKVKGSVSIIYPFTITSMTDTQITNYLNSGVNKNLARMTKICDDTLILNYSSKSITNQYNLKWFDTIIDRTFKYSIFVTYNIKNKGIDDNFTYDLSTQADGHTAYNAFDRIVKFQLGIESGEWLSPSSTISSNNPAGTVYKYTTKESGINSKNVVKTFSGLRKLISEIYTLDGWETLNVTEFYYETAMVLSYIPNRIPVKLTKIHISSVQGMTYFGGIFNSNITEAFLDYKQSGINNNESGISKSIATYDSLIDLNDYLNENSELKLTSLRCSMITEESYVLLSKICKNGGITNNLNVITSTIYSGSGYISFYDINNVMSYLSNMNPEGNDNSSKLTIKPFNKFNLYDILKKLYDYYGQVNGPTDENTLSSETTYYFTESLDEKYSILGPTGTIFGKEYQSSDFIPDWNLGKENYNVAIVYKHDNDSGIRIFKEISGNSDNNEENQYDVKIATFKSTKGNNGIIEGTTLSKYTYTLDDLNVFEPSEFDPEWVRFLISLLSTTGGSEPGKVEAIKINNYSSNINALKAYQYHNGNNYSYGITSNPRSSQGYAILYDKIISNNSNIYYIIINTKYFSYEYNNNSTGPRSYSYTTIDMKGWEKLPFTAITIGAGKENSEFTINKIVNTNGTVSNPKISYLGIGINWRSDSTSFKWQTILEDISGLDKSLMDDATVYFGSHIKLKSEFIKYDPNIGLTLNTIKTFNTSIESSKMHTLQYNGDYETSYDYMYLKQEIIKSIINNNPLIYKNYYDTMVAAHNNMFSLCTGGLTNITLFANNLNHPFVNDDSILFYDSVYSYYIKTKKAGQVIYFGSKYDSSKMIGTLINMNSDRIRTLSNNNYISILDNSSNGRVQVDEEIRYSLTEGATIKLPHYDSNGSSIVYYAVTTYNNSGKNVYILEGVKHSSGNDYNSMGSTFSDLFEFKEYEFYWEISLKENHKLYMEMNYEFVIYKDNSTYISDGTLTNENIKNRINTSQGIQGRFYVDINYIPNIGHYVIKDTDPLTLPKTLTILGKECDLNYTVESSYANYFNITDNSTYYTYSLTNQAQTVNNIKIQCTFSTTRYSYGSHSVTSEIQMYYGQWEDNTTYKIYRNGNLLQSGVLDETDYNYYIGRGYMVFKIVTQVVTGFYDETYIGSFKFFVNVTAGSNTNTTSNTYNYVASDFYVEILFNTITNEYIPGSLIYDSEGKYIESDYIDSSGIAKTGYEWRKVPANDIIESGLLLTDMFYSGALSIGSTEYTTHHTVNSTLNNVDFFPKYVVVDYYGEFVLNNGNLITFDNNQKTAAVNSVTTGTYKDLNYHLALIYTKEQIANIHYFSNTCYSTKIDFRAQSVLNGLEIFPLTHVRFGYYNPDNYGWSESNNSRAFPGNTFKCFKDMKLEEFVLVFKHTSIYVSDWTFLFNSRDTLTNFMYGGIKTGHAETYGTTHDDFSFLLSFDNLENVILYGLPGIQDTQNFKYFINTMYLKHNKNIVRYFYNTNKDDKNEIFEYTTILTGISADITSSSTILSSYNTTDINGTSLSSFTYQNGYELYLGDETSYYSQISNYDSTDSTTQYLLPSYINDGGTYYKLTYDSLSNFAEIIAIKKSDNTELTMLQYQDAYAQYVLNCLTTNKEINDYDFATDYEIYVRFKNLSNCLTDRIMISAKIECQSKMESKDDVLAIDLSDNALKTNYTSGSGYSAIYYDGEKYVYTPYTYQRFMSIYVDHTQF